MQIARARLVEIWRFCLSGAAGVIAYYAVLYCLTEYLGVWYLTSTVIGFILNTGLNFKLQKSWTFGNKDTTRIRSLLAIYFSVAIAFQGLNTICLYLMVQYLHMWYMEAQMVLTVVISIISYFITKQIFKPRPQPLVPDSGRP